VEPLGFRPVPWLPGRHLQTIVPSLWPVAAVSERSESRVVGVAQGSSVRVMIDRPASGRRGTLVLVHGMSGSAESAYMRRTARQALCVGWAVVRMNLRNCGGTEHLSSTLYNAGQSGDLACVLEHLQQQQFPRPFAAAGFSLGGNIVLLYAGRSGDACLADAVAAVNPPIDLEACARAIGAPSNRIYQAYYVLRLCRQVKRVARVRAPINPPPVRTEIRTVRRFDELYTAPDGGFASAEEYYARSSAAPTLSDLRRPAMLLSALDDPFVPPEMFVPHHGNPRLRLLQPRHGGHCGYWQSGTPRFWAAEAILGFVGSC